MSGSDEKRHECEVLQVFSADDLVVMVDLGVEQLYKKQRIRLHGVDAPSGVREGPDTVGGKLRTYVRDLCKGRRVEILINSRGPNTWVVTAWVLLGTGQHNLNEDLIAQGYAYKRESI